MNKKSIFVILIVSALVLGACFSPWKGDKGTFSIRIGGEAGGRAAFDLDEKNIPQLLHTITLSNGPGPKQEHPELNYGDTVNFSVTPGRWTITVTAFLGKEIYAEGSATEYIFPGPNGAIKIPMTLINPQKPIEPVVPDVYHTVTFMVDDIPYSIPVVHGKTISSSTSPGILIIYEYMSIDDFIGWYTAPEGGEAWDIESQEITSPITLYARFEDGAEIPIINQTPAATDYIIGNLIQTAGNVTAVTIIPESDKSEGAITIYYEGINDTAYAKSQIVPQAIGTYAVTFDVAAAEGWNPASGLPAGTLIINNLPTPHADDYTIGETTFTYDGSAKTVTVTVKPGDDKSPGAVTAVKYDGYAAAPTDAGEYIVTFDVAAAEGWNAASNLSAGTLTINKANPVITEWPTAAAITLGDTLSASNLTGGESTPAGTFAWTDGTINPPVGISNQSVTFTPTDSNYNTATQNVSITVNRQQGNAVLEITFELKDIDPPGDNKEITLTSDNPTQTINVVDSSTYKSINWNINGITGKGSSFILKKANYSPGVYYLTVEVITYDGEYYSQTITVTVKE